MRTETGPWTRTSARHSILHPASVSSYAPFTSASTPSPCFRIAILLTAASAYLLLAVSSFGRLFDVCVRVSTSASHQPTLSTTTRKPPNPGVVDWKLSPRPGYVSSA
ncbi:hypothetical protein LZ32DRAFT_326414 [Colletotrichum eremochloae]|nr:hypothetical protein LZ32DRAFT_326414 [Colletotrichum eremochloae]